MNIKVLRFEMEVRRWEMEDVAVSSYVSSSSEVKRSVSRITLNLKQLTINNNTSNIQGFGSPLLWRGVGGEANN